MTGRATEGGAKFESGSRGGAEKESGWSSGWGLCRKIYLFVCSDPTGGPCQLWLLGAHTSILCGWQLCPWLALTSLLCSPTDSCSPVWPICHFVCSEPSFVLEALCLVPYGCFAALWMVFHSLFLVLVLFFFLSLLLIESCWLIWMVVWNVFFLGTWIGAVVVFFFFSIFSSVSSSFFQFGIFEYGALPSKVDNSFDSPLSVS